VRRVYSWGLAESYVRALLQILFLGLRCLENEDLMRSSDHRSYVVFVACGGEKNWVANSGPRRRGGGFTLRVS
jgi:hypothetical protein